MPVCPSCGQENPYIARFCLACGAALADEATPGREERKVVTVLFCDLVGSPARAEGADPEDVRALLSAYHERVQHELERFGGTVEKSSWPLAPAPRQEGMASGDVVNTAARLQSAAPENGVLVDEATQRATGQAISTTSPKWSSRKGKPSPSAYGRRWRREHALASTSFARRARRFWAVHRARGLARGAGARSRGAPAAARHPRRRAGHRQEPARLRAAPCRRAGLGADLLATGRSLPYGEGVSYSALAEMVRAHTGVLETDSAEQTREKLSGRSEGDAQLQHALAFWRSVGAARYIRECESPLAESA